MTKGQGESLSWPLLEQAVDAKIEEQEEFVRWWGGNVQTQGRKSRNPSSEISLSVTEAEKSTKISDGQVCRWRRHLGNKEKYRERIIVAGYWGAGGLQGPPVSCPC